VATLAVYGQTVSREFEFLNVDDPDYVTANPHVQDGLTADSLRWAWTTFHAHNWHPLTWMSLELDDQLFGLSAPGFHFTNVLLHVANTLLLFWLLNRLTGAVWPSAAVAGFFALHPTHVESVAWVTERKDVLSTLFWLLTIAAYAWYAERPGVGRYLLVVLAFVLALAAKPMVVTLPAVLLLLDYWPLRRWQIGDAVPTKYARASLGWLIVEKLPLFALVAATVPLTLRAQEGVIRTLDQLSFPVRAENALVAYAEYLGMTVWPVNLAIFYPYPGALPLWQPVAAGLLLVALTAGVLWAGRRRPYLVTGWFWFLGTLVPVIGLVQVGQQVLADRYTYVPSIGLYLLLAWAAADLVSQRRSLAKPLAALAGVLLALCLALAWLQVRHWRNNEALWEHAAEITRDNTVAHEYLGVILLQRGDLAAAEEHFRESLRVDPASSATQGNLALVLERQGKLDEAAEHLELALRLDPKSVPAHVALARVRERMGWLDDALGQYFAALQIDPNSAEAQVGLGGVLEAQGKFAEAQQHYEALLRSRPESPAAHAALGRVLNLQGKPAEALAHYEAALRLEPNAAEAHNNKGVALERLGRLAEAAACYQRAIDLDPQQVVYRCNLAYALFENGESTAAKAQYQEASRLNPNWPRQALQEAWTRATHPEATARNGTQALRIAKQVCQATDYRMPMALDVLAAAHAELGRFDEAVTWERKALALVPRDAPPEAVKVFQERLRLFESRQPFRQQPAGAMK
jgi:tetratricopeptide (TPR) repeat protein